jgi:hypothetical protein
VNVDCFELVNYHSGLCLTEYELEAQVDPCNGSNGDDLWTTYYGASSVNDGSLTLPIYRLQNIHYGDCLGSSSLGLGGTGMNTCSSNHGGYWYLPDIPGGSA